MPTYDYRCKACGHTFELYQTMSEGEKRKCPQCAKNSLERLIGAGAGLIFKGSGYYLTDYRSKSYEEGAKAERDAAKAPEATASTSDSKDTSSKDSANPKDSSAKDAAKPKDSGGSKGAGSSDSKAAKSDSGSASKRASSAKKSSPKRKQ